MSEPKYLIRKEEIEAMAGLQKTHFLNPDAKRTNKSLGDATGLTGIGFHIIEVQPGDATTEHHLHHYEDECVYVLAGQATAYLGDDAFEIKAGDFLGYRKGGLAHSIKNSGDTPLRCIVAGERLAHDVGEYPRLNKRLYRNPGMTWDLVDRAAIETPDANAGKKVTG